MKIGIMTMHRVVNHGSFMQAYGLKSMIESLGHTVEFVDYKVMPTVFARADRKELLRYRKRRLKQSLKTSALGVAIASLIGKGEKSAAEKMYDRTLGMIGVSPTVRNERPKLDALVIGSDEVFNCLQSNDSVGFSPELFGCNNRASRLLSYAASFGSTTLKGLRDFGVDAEIAEYLSKFDALSVRDENSYNIAKELGREDAICHLDPVLVSGIEKLPWRFGQKVDGKYLAVYGYANRFSAEEGKRIQEYANKTGLKTVSVYGKQDFCDEHVDCAPDEIFSLLRGAENVVTDTFHGTIFSVILHKNVAIFQRKQKGDLKAPTNQEKLIDLVKKLALDSRLVTKGRELDQIFSEDIDFARLDEYRQAERERSLSFLSQSIDGE